MKQLFSTMAIHLFLIKKYAFTYNYCTKLNIQRTTFQNTIIKHTVQELRNLPQCDSKLVF